jgi:hypothetical protein
MRRRTGQPSLRNKKTRSMTRPDFAAAGRADVERPRAFG